MSKLKVNYFIGHDTSILLYEYAWIYYMTFGYCKGGTLWMRNWDWSTLDLGKSWKRGVVLFKGNCNISRHYLSVDAKHII